jgi:hypothetical protein
LTPADGGQVLRGTIQRGPCPTLTTPNCLQLTSGGSFTVQGVLTHLLPGEVPTVRIAVVDALGAPRGIREVQCAPADPGGRSVCNARVAEVGILPQLGGVVEVRLARAPTPVPTATPTALPVALPLLPPPPMPLLPPRLLLPPPPPSVPPPGIGPGVPPPAPLPGQAPVALPTAGPAASTAFPEVPVIPEAEGLLLLLVGLVAVGALAGMQSRGRSRTR